VLKAQITHERLFFLFLFLLHSNSNPPTNGGDAYFKNVLLVLKFWSMQQAARTKSESSQQHKDAGFFHLALVFSYTTKI